MTTHPPERPAEWESSRHDVLARDGLRPARPAAEWPTPARPRHAGGYPADDYPPLSDHPSLPGHPPLSDHPSLPGFAPLSDHPSLPGYPPLSDHPSLPGYPPLSDHPSLPGFAPLSDHPSLPGYPPLSDHPSLPGYAPAPESWPGHDYAADWHVDHDEYGHPSDTTAAVATADPAPALTGRVTGGPGVDELPLLAPATLAPPGPAPTRVGVRGTRMRPRARPVASEDAQWAMLAYLTVPVFGCLVSLAIYLLSLRGSRWLRAHAAQALNVWLTWLLYNLSALIVGGLLALDSPHLALIIVLPVASVLSLIILSYLTRAARLASQGREYLLPRWLCSRLVR